MTAYVLAIQDLIKPQNSDLQIRENENGVYVAGVSEHEVSSMDDCLNFLHVGDRNRHSPTLTSIAYTPFKSPLTFHSISLCGNPEHLPLAIPPLDVVLHSPFHEVRMCSMVPCCMLCMQIGLLGSATAIMASSLVRLLAGR